MHIRYLKLFLLIFGLVIGANAISTLLFLNDPERFYFRPWEYFPEVAYRVHEIEPKWEGVATSDQTRNNFYYYQDEHNVITTVDSHGFRTQPDKKGDYKILVGGDSTIFGSGLSDNQTFPWILSELMNTDIFNGGRSGLFNTIQKEELQSVEIVIDGVVERVINSSGVYVNYGYQEGDDYQPLLRNDISRFDLYQHVPTARYLATSIILRNVDRIKEDLKTKFSGGEKAWLFNNHEMSPSDLESALKSIKQRHDRLARRNIRYIFMPVPSKQTLYDDNIDSYTRNYISLLIEALNNEGVETINLLSEFNAAKSEYQLYRNYDTHWNENGTRIAAKVVADYLRNSQK